MLRNRKQLGSTILAPLMLLWAYVFPLPCHFRGYESLFVSSYQPDTLFLVQNLKLHPLFRPIDNTAYSMDHTILHTAELKFKVWCTKYSKTLLFVSQKKVVLKILMSNIFFIFYLPQPSIQLMCCVRNHHILSLQCVPKNLI